MNYITNFIIEIIIINFIIIFIILHPIIIILIMVNSLIIVVNNMIKFQNFIHHKMDFIKNYNFLILVKKNKLIFIPFY